MGMDAELLAIGPYSPEIKDHLEYPANYYSDTPIGATIITLVGVSVTTVQSEQMARALGINPWQFQEHCYLEGDNADLELLMESMEGYEDDLADFLALKAHGFKFFYRPNG